MSDIEIEVDKILSRVTGTNPDSRDILLHFAQGLSLADVAGIRESCETKKVGVGYVVNALKNRQAERKFVNLIVTISGSFAEDFDDGDIQELQDELRDACRIEFGGSGIVVEVQKV